MVRDDFWKKKRLDQLTPKEWESLCDGCARCCLLKLEDEDSGRTLHTDVACRLLDQDTCRCSRYGERQKLVPDCLRLDVDLVAKLSWLPGSCAYRLVAEGKDLSWWHPLVSGRPETVHEAGISVRWRVISEEDVPESELEDHIADWPGVMPRRTRRKDRRGER